MHINTYNTIDTINTSAFPTRCTVLVAESLKFAVALKSLKVLAVKIVAYLEQTESTTETNTEIFRRLERTIPNILIDNRRILILILKSLECF